MHKILIGIPSIREDDKFYASVDSLIKQMKGKYDVSIIWEKWQFLPVAQNRISRYFLDNDFDYLMFLDDDHAGHTVEMVDSMITCNTYVVTMKTYIRHFPYPCGLMVWHPDVPKLFVGVERDSGTQEIDMCGFPMTLIRRDLFKVMGEQPYFQSRLSGDRMWTTDELFCERLRKLGIRPMGIFDYCLDHLDITKDNVFDMRNKNAMTAAQKLQMKIFTGQIRLNLVGGVGKEE